MNTELPLELEVYVLDLSPFSNNQELIIKLPIKLVIQKNNIIILSGGLLTELVDNYEVVNPITT